MLQTKLLAVPPSVRVLALPIVVPLTVTTAPATDAVAPTLEYAVSQLLMAAERFDATVPGVVLLIKVPVVELVQLLVPVGAGIVVAGLRAALLAGFVLLLQPTVPLVRLVTVITLANTVAVTLAFADVMLWKHPVLGLTHCDASLLIAARRLPAESLAAPPVKTQGSVVQKVTAVWKE